MIRWLKIPVDLVISVLAYMYFGLVYALFFLPPYAVAVLLSKNPHSFGQRINHHFYRSFFFLLRLLVPGLRIRVGKGIRSLGSAIVVCNHRSYLDSILLTSLFKRHRTVVRADLFGMPVLGFVLRNAGYIPSATGLEAAALLSGQLETLAEFIAGGGILFLFPEGTRSRDGSLGSFKKGAFSIARKCRVPIEILRVTNTDVLFPPGSWLFRTCVRNTITLEHIGTLEPDYDAPGFSLPGLIDEVRSRYLDLEPDQGISSAGEIQ